MAGGTSAFASLSLADGTSFSQAAGSLTLAGGLSPAGSAFYNLQAAGAALYLRLGSAGGAVDSLSDVAAAVAAGQLRARGQTAPLSAFNVFEVDVGGTAYIKVALKSLGTVISVR
jgi:hypothetical protein